MEFHSQEGLIFMFNGILQSVYFIIFIDIIPII